MALSPEFWSRKYWSGGPIFSLKILVPPDHFFWKNMSSLKILAPPPNVVSKTCGCGPSTCWMIEYIHSISQTGNTIWSDKLNALHSFKVIANITQINRLCWMMTVLYTFAGSKFLAFVAFTTRTIYKYCSTKHISSGIDFYLELPKLFDAPSLFFTCIGPLFQSFSRNTTAVSSVAFWVMYDVIRTRSSAWSSWLLVSSWATALK